MQTASQFVGLIVCVADRADPRSSMHGGLLRFLHLTRDGTNVTDEE
jgi:hypothetical protein